jgi:hypothetical protein
MDQSQHKSFTIVRQASPDDLLGQARHAAKSLNDQYPSRRNACRNHVA